jgi:hypothetical protein
MSNLFCYCFGRSGNFGQSCGKQFPLLWRPAGRCYRQVNIVIVILDTNSAVCRLVNPRPLVILDTGSAICHRLQRRCPLVLTRRRRWRDRYRRCEFGGRRYARVRPPVAEDRTGRTQKAQALLASGAERDNLSYLAFGFTPE